MRRCIKEKADKKKMKNETMNFKNYVLTNFLKPIIHEEFCLYCLRLMFEVNLIELFLFFSSFFNYNIMFSISTVLFRP